MQIGDTWYRYDDTHYAPSLDESENPVGEGQTRVHLYELTVKKITPKGVWVAWGFCAPRFILLTATKRYACPTKAEALESLRRRRERQRSIYMARIRKIDKTLHLVKALATGKSELDLEFTP